jgi:hypothetical protein
MRGIYSVAALGLCIIAGYGASAHASVVQVTSRSDLSGPTFDFGSFGAPGTFISTPESEPGGPGAVTVASSSGSLYVKQEGTDWNGNFAVGNNLLAQADDDRSDSFVISFAGAPVYGVGTQIQPASQYYGPFTAEMELFGTGGADLGTVTADGTSTTAQDNSAPFIGATSTMPIAYVEFLVSTGYPGFPTEGDLAINELSFSDTPPVSVPEPGTEFLLGSALLGIAAAKRFRPRA